MAITTAVCNSFKTEVLEGEHDFGVSQQVFKIALYLTGATINKSTTSYGTTQESSGTFTIQFPANDSSNAIIRITS